jgi:hypothetical protein
MGVGWVSVGGAFLPAHISEARCGAPGLVSGSVGVSVLLGAGVASWVSSGMVS